MNCLLLTGFLLLLPAAGAIGGLPDLNSPLVERRPRNSAWEDLLHVERIVDDYAYGG